MLAEPSQLTGGLLHYSWLIKTETGNFVIKILNPSIINKTGGEARYRTTEHIASALSNNVPTITALTVNGKPIYSFEKNIVMVFPYIYAKIIAQNNITSLHIKQIARTLAKVHQTSIYIANIPPVEILSFKISDWISRYDKIKPAEKKLAQALDKTFLMIKDIIQKYETHIPSLTENLVISHRDCDPKNVLWDNQGQHYLIDWESAGAINITKDTVTTALYWSLNANYKINFASLRIFIKAYLEHAGNINVNELKAALYGFIADWLGWLDFNLSRVVSHQQNTNEYNLGLSESLNTLSALPKIIEQFPTILHTFRLIIFSRKS